VSTCSSSDERRAIADAPRRRRVTHGSMPLAGFAKKFTRTEFIASVLAGAGRKEAPRRDERDPFSP
jgi:hypothetical protein